jgi:transcriptional regulator with XRE-family HTH domain
VLGALEWARVRTLAADGLSQREIARRLGINRRTVVRLLACEEPPRYRRASAGSQLDRFEPVLRRLVEEWPEIKAPRATEVLREYGYVGSVDVVRRRLRELRPPVVRPAQRTGYRPGCHHAVKCGCSFRPRTAVTSTLHNFRTREWRPAQLAADIDPICLPYDLRDTYPTFALRTGISIFEVPTKVSYAPAVGFFTSVSR